MNKKSVLCCVGTFSVTLIVLWLLLIGVATISNNRIKENMQKSAMSYGRQEAFAFCDGNKWNGVADNYADSIWLNIAWYMGKGDPVYATLDTKYYDGEEQGENVGLYLAVTEETVEPNIGYTRYWHGTAGILRVMHLFTDVNGIKRIGLCTALFLAMAVAVMLCMDKKVPLALGFLLSLCAIEVWKIGLSVEYQPSFILCFVMCILYLWAEKKGDEKLVILSVAGGVATAFFDFLTTETIVILVPLILVVAVRGCDGRLKEWQESWKCLLGCASAWAVSYVGTFLVKWLMATLVIGENQFFVAWASVEERVAGSVDEVLPGGAIGKSIFSVLSNLSVFFGAEGRVDGMLALVGVVLSAGVAATVWYLLGKKKRNKAATILLLSLGLVVFVRFIVLANQSYLHSFFTYRALFSSVLAICMVLVVNCEVPGKQKRQRKK